MSTGGGARAVARVFVGLPLGPELGATVGERVAALLPRREWRLAHPGGLHATLLFLGAVARGRLTGLEEALGRALAGAGPLGLRLGGAGAFPDRARPRVLWIGVEERGAVGQLEGCRARVVRALLEAGCDLGDELARPFRPHVTVARPRRARARAPEVFQALSVGLDWDPPAVVLYESRPQEGGRAYEALATWPLAPRQAVS